MPHSHSHNFHSHTDHHDKHHSHLHNTIAPTTRIVCTLIMVIAIVATPDAHWLTWLIYGCGIIVLLGMSQVDLFKLYQRLAVESIFVSVSVLGILFRDGEGIVWQWGFLKITLTGLLVFGSVLCKLGLTLVLMNLLTLTIPIPVLLQNLSILRVPPLLIAILGSMYRYLDLLVEEFTVMRRAAIARNLLAGKRWQRLVIGNMIGSLFIRTYNRGDRIHQSMLSRGYQGVLPSKPPPKLNWRDRLAFGFTILFAIVGQVAFYS
jgi:cobalt/nickel transport system permease protein